MGYKHEANMDTKIVYAYSRQHKRMSFFHLRVTSKGFDRACAWSGLPCILMFCSFWIAAHFLPPIDPKFTPEQVVDHYRHYETSIKVGSIMMVFSGALYGSFTACMSTQMARIPKVSHTVLSTQLASGAWACATYTFPGMFFAVTVFRLSRSPELTQLLNDISQIIAFMPFPPFIIQNWAFAYAIFCDNRPKRLFPHLMGWNNIISPVLFSGAIAMHCTKNGPFAWDGVLAFWIPGIVFAIQFFINIYFVVRAVEMNLPEDDESPATAMV